MNNEYSLIKIRLPFHLDSLREECFTYVDIETRKVPCAPILRENGETLKMKWEPFMIGTGFFFENEWFVEIAFDMGDWAAYVEAIRSRSEVMIYRGTREFDEMVLKGRFSTARRAHFPRRPEGWSGVEEDSFAWENLNSYPVPHDAAFKRGEDVPSKLVPVIWPHEGSLFEESFTDHPDVMKVLVHNFRDVLELMFSDPRVYTLDPSDYLVAKRMMEDFDYCANFIAAFAND